MAINFAAESMQGYNNPEIEIVNVEVDNKSGLITQITFDDIAKILARGVFPILSSGGVIQGKRMRYIMPLTYAIDTEILFSTIVMDGNSGSPPSATGLGLKFSTTAPPLLLRMPLRGSDG